MLADDKSSSFFCHLIISSVFLFLFLFFFSGRNLGSSCPLGTFRCLGNDSEIGVCLPRRLLCDNRPDCPDGSDEDPLKCCEFLFIRVRFFSHWSVLRVVQSNISVPFWRRNGGNQSLTVQLLYRVKTFVFYFFHFIVPTISTSSCPLHASLMESFLLLLFIFFYADNSWQLRRAPIVCQRCVGESGSGIDHRPSHRLSLLRQLLWVVGWYPSKKPIIYFFLLLFFLYGTTAAKAYPRGCTCQNRTWLFCLNLDLMLVPQVEARLSRLYVTFF